LGIKICQGRLTFACQITDNGGNEVRLWIIGVKLGSSNEDSTTQTLKASTISWGLHHRSEVSQTRKGFAIPDGASHRSTSRRRNDISEDVVFLAFDGKGPCEASNGSFGCRVLQENKKANSC